MKRYDIFPVDTKISKRVKSLDWLIIAANCDKRAYAISSKLKNDPNIALGNLCVFDYDKFKPKEDDADNYAQYMIYSTLNPEKVISCIDRDDDIDGLAKLAISETQIVGIDITGFAIPDIFRIMFVLSKIQKITLVYAFYAEPRQYPYKDGIFDSYELLGGECTYEALPEYGSSGLQTGEKLNETLVCFLGFDKGKARYMHEKINPSNTVVINGFPPYLPKYKDISLVNNRDLLNIIGIDSIHYAEAKNPFASYNALDSIRKQYDGDLLTVCVLGTKPMALGACIFSLKNADNLKVVYPYPTEYAKNTSDESDRNWCYIVDL